MAEPAGFARVPCNLESPSSISETRTDIVATMLAYGIFSILTHNTSDFQRFAGYITIIPLQDTIGVTA